MHGCHCAKLLLELLLAAAAALSSSIAVRCCWTKPHALIKRKRRSAKCHEYVDAQCGDVRQTSSAACVADDLMLDNKRGADGGLRVV